MSDLNLYRYGPGELDWRIGGPDGPTLIDAASRAKLLEEALERIAKREVECLGPPYKSENVVVSDPENTVVYRDGIPYAEAVASEASRALEAYRK